MQTTERTINVSIKARKRLSWALLAVALGIVAWQGTVVQKVQVAREQAETQLDLALAGSSNGLFDWAVPSSPDYWDNAHCWFSPYFNELLGYHETRLSSKFGAFFSLVNAEDRNRLTAAFHTAINRKNSVDVTFQAKHQDGTYHWYIIKGKYSINGHRRISGSMFDITQRKMERQRADLIILSSPDAVIVCNASREIILYNPAAQRMFGYGVGEMIGRPVDKIVTAEYLTRHNTVFTEAVAQLQAKAEDWTIRKDDIQGEGICKNGHEFPVILSVRGIKYRGTLEFIATIKRPDMPEPNSAPLPDPAMFEQQSVWRAEK